MVRKFFRQNYSWCFFVIPALIITFFSFFVLSLQKQAPSLKAHAATTYSISGDVLIDTNGDCLGDMPVPETIRLDINYSPSTWISYTSTNNGKYAFNNLEANRQYKVWPTFPQNYQMACNISQYREVYLDTNKTENYVLASQNAPTPTSAPPTPTSTHPSPSVNFTREDVNRDGAIDILDFNLWLRAYSSGVSDPYTYPDINGDGLTDILDFNLWYRSVTNPSTTTNPTPTGSLPTLTPGPSSFTYGVNFSSGAFGTSRPLPGTYGTDYIFADSTSYDYFKNKGFMLVRLPFLWERLQHSLYGPLDPAELGRLDGQIAFARARGMKIILDPHNYARYFGNIIGSPAVPDAAFADFWRKLADHYKAEPAIYGYGLMNEPHDTGSHWQTSAQAAVNAIRQVDMSHLILVPGDDWSSAAFWVGGNDGLKNLSDPANNYIFEAHQYFDKDYTGSYTQSYDASGAYPNIGVDRAKPFVDWLKANGKRGFLGEYGVPDNDPRWLTVLDNFLAYLKANNVGGTYWAAGPWWGNYTLSVEPINGQDRPQMPILIKYR